jgi:flagella basal body P-ring formation protein FlgA
MIIGVGMRCLLLSLALLFLPAAGAGAEMRPDMAALRTAARQFVVAQVAAAYPDAHAEVAIGPVDERQSLPHCPEPEFALSPGGTLWGGGRLGVSCPPGAGPSLYLTFRATLRGPALVARRPLPARHAPGPADLETAEIEYAGDPGRYPRQPETLRGAALLRPLAKGSPVTIELLRIQPVIRTGQRVRIRLQGPGFQISQEGVAQTQAGPGESVRLKVGPGRFIQGIAQPDGSVLVKP